MLPSTPPTIAAIWGELPLMPAFVPKELGVEVDDVDAPEVCVPLID
jgi:hypothetical protein